MLEKVARAICLEAGLDPDRKFKSSNWGPETAPHEFAWNEFLPSARAAIGALREPDAKLLLAGEATGDAYEGCDPEECWPAMIDAILKG